jgi:hypothetical protein
MAPPTPVVTVELAAGQVHWRPARRATLVLKLEPMVLVVVQEAQPAL